MNRYVGLKSGQTYHFDTTIQNANTHVTLKQSMTGTWSGSHIKHAMQTASATSPWYSDRNIHRMNMTYQSLAAQTAVTAEFTGGYDDFHYTIHQNTVPEAVSSDANELKVLTYNIYALPMIASKIPERLAELPQHLQGYDVIMMQEAFASSRGGFLNHMASQYPLLQTHIPVGSSRNLYDSGLVIVSRYPIVKTAQLIYPDCTGTDCFADKGVLYAEIIKNGKAYHVTSTHTASFDTNEARALRQVQFKKFVSWSTNKIFLRLMLC